MKDSDAKFSRFVVEAGSGIDLIASERDRQVQDEGYDAQHDAEHMGAELAWAAACYAAPGRIYKLVPTDKTEVYLRDPWPHSWDRKGASTPAGRIALLVKAGALCAAEVDRLRRREFEVDVEIRR